MVLQCRDASDRTTLSATGSPMMLIAAVQGVASGDPFAKCALTAACHFPMLTVNQQPRCACITADHSLYAWLFAPRSLSLLAAPGPSSCGRASRRRRALPRSRPSLTTACPRTASSRSAWRAAPRSPTPPWTLLRRSAQRKCAAGDENAHSEEMECQVYAV
jgi:hypothetical protein